MLLKSHRNSYCVDTWRLGGLGTEAAAGGVPARLASADLRRRRFDKASAVGRGVDRACGDSKRRHNSDDEVMTEHAEAILMGSAFEQLFGTEHKYDLAKAFGEHVGKFGGVTVAEAQKHRPETPETMNKKRLTRLTLSLSAYLALVIAKPLPSARHENGPTSCYPPKGGEAGARVRRIAFNRLLTIC